MRREECFPFALIINLYKHLCSSHTDSNHQATMAFDATLVQTQTREKKFAEPKHECRFVQLSNCQSQWCSFQGAKVRVQTTATDFTSSNKISAITSANITRKQVSKTPTISAELSQARPYLSLQTPAAMRPAVRGHFRLHFHWCLLCQLLLS